MSAGGLRAACLLRDLRRAAMLLAARRVFSGMFRPQRQVSRVWPCVMACAALAATAPLPAQVLTRVDLDNDAFNFWQPPWRRADREYTQGTRIGVFWPTASGVARRLLGGRHDCTTIDARARDCRMLFVVGTQAMYTPSLDQRLRTPEERPFAGWLGGEFGVQRDHARGLTAFSVSVGVTGRASLAEPGQKFVHRLLRFRPPVGWNEQLPNEVAAMVTYRGAHDVVRLRHQRSGFGVIAAPEWQARLGTIATDATAGFQLLTGVRPPSPWNTAASTDRGRWGVFVRAGVAHHVIARNMFLDGTLFTDSRRVRQKKSNFGETELGLGLRMPAGLVEWRVHSQGGEYELQPRPHAYSTFAISIR